MANLKKNKILSKSKELHHNIGVDIERVDRFRNYASKKVFFSRIYTEREQRYCLSKGSPAEHFAGRFAAKEAVKKALSALIKEPLNYSDVEIINLKNGLPVVLLKKNLADKFYISLSISHTKDAAVAVALITLPK